ncbi:protease modulator HflC [Deltaproteobacteria bacterium TL4]
MQSSILKSLLMGIAALLLILYSSTYIVDKTQYAIAIRLGEPLAADLEPGLKFKLPFITQVKYMDNRLLTYDSDPGSVFTKDKKEMIVDNYAKWKIVDPLKFYEAVKSVEGAQSRLDDMIYSQTREVMGRYSLTEAVSGTRTDIMVEITSNAKKMGLLMGFEIMDVRIKRTDLPESNSRAVYGRMEAERRRIAKQYRSQGDEKALEIRSAADRDRITIMAQAQKTAEELSGDAEAEVVKIYADAYEKDPEFYAFKRSHDVYRETLQEGTTLLMDSSRPLFKHFNVK